MSPAPRLRDDRRYTSEPKLFATYTKESLAELSLRLTASVGQGVWLETQGGDIENSLLSFASDDRMNAAIALPGYGGSNSVWSAEITTARSQ